MVQLARNTEALMEIIRKMFKKGYAQIPGALEMLINSKSGMLSARKHFPLPNVVGVNRLIACRHYQHTTEPLFLERDTLRAQVEQLMKAPEGDPYEGKPEKVLARDMWYFREGLHLMAGIGEKIEIPAFVGECV